jgi:steroid delta-isomerase-like uncharacterized protein
VKIACRLTAVLFSLVFMTVATGYAGDDPETDQESANKAVMEWIFANGVNAHNPDAWDSVLTEDYVRHCEAMPPEAREIHGIEQMKAFLAETFAAFPDWREDIVYIVAEGDKVALMTHGIGTMQGSFGNLEPTGKKAEVTNIMFMRFENGKVAETWITWDNLYFLEQIGLLPPSMTPPDEEPASESDEDE